MKEKNMKYFIILSVLISITALTLGYAALTSSLTIKSSAQYTFDSSNWRVYFSKSNSSLTTGTVTPTVTGGATGVNVTVGSNSTTLSGLKANFTTPGQTVKYSLYSYNAGTLAAYLNSVTVPSVSGSSISCAPDTGSGKNPATASYVSTACNGISVSVKVGTATYNSTNTAINSHSLANGTGEAVEVTITYATGSQIIDGDMTVTIGDVKLQYGSVD